MVGFMNSEPLISVIVPVYGVEKYFEKCVSSICSQTYTNLEIILVDDGSPDRCPQICDMLASKDPRILVIHKRNGGLSSARNAGMDACHGEYIGFVDSDDYLEADMYSDLYKAIKGKKHALGVTGIIVEDEGALISSRSNFDKTTESKKEYIKSLLLHKGDVSACSKLFPREMIGALRFDESKLNEDLLFMFSMETKIDELVYTNKAGYHYVCHPGSTSQKFGKAIHDMVENAAWVRAYVDSNYPEYSEVAERFEIFQNLAFAWVIPEHYDRSKDHLCVSSVSFLRRNYLRALKNPYLTVKDKIRISIICVDPHLVSFFNKG